MVRKRHVVFLVGLIGSAAGAAVGAPQLDSTRAQREAENLDRLPPVTPHGGIHLDHSGRKQRGKASYYAAHFAAQRMADGRTMNPNTDIAASKTLPLGSVAKVTNLENGRTATVKVEDRGPFVDGRVVDLAPKVAAELDLKRRGVVPVEVKPVTVPLPDGGIRLGAGAADATPQEVEQATQVTRELAGTSETEAANR